MKEGRKEGKNEGKKEGRKEDEEVHEKGVGEKMSIMMNTIVYVCVIQNLVTNLR